MGLATNQGVARTRPNLDLDSPDASIQHSQLIRSKLFLREIYREHYQYFRSEIAPVPAGAVVELGSGGGFIREVLPAALTSDVVRLPDASLVMSGLSLPFADSSISAIVMINVLHHLQDVGAFLHEAQRALKPGGKIVMVEPANTLFSNFIYRNFHHEPFDPAQVGWTLPKGGRMSVANDALPWIVFCRDRAKLSREFPDLAVRHVRNFMPLRYILSGGVSKPQLLPDLLYGPLCWAERVLQPFNNLCGLFMKISVERC